MYKRENGIAGETCKSGSCTVPELEQKRKAVTQSEVPKHERCTKVKSLQKIEEITKDKEAEGMKYEG